MYIHGGKGLCYHMGGVGDNHCCFQLHTDYLMVLVQNSLKVWSQVEQTFSFQPLWKASI